jgi:O-antigen/teichoic acid export membrane protein
MAPLALTVNMLTLGLPEAVTYFSARFPASARRLAVVAIGALAAVGLIATIALILVGPLLSGGDASLVPLIAIAAVAAAPTLALLGARAWAAGRGMWRLIAYEGIISAVIRVLVVFLLGVAGQLSLRAAVLALAITGFVGLAPYLVSLAIAPKQRDSGEGERPSLAAPISFGMKTWLGSVSGSLLLSLDQVLMTPLSSTYELGLYVVAVNVAQVARIVRAPLRTVVLSLESRAADSSRLEQLSRISTAGIALGAAGLGLISVWLIPIFFGREFHASIPVLLVLLGSVVAGNAGSVISSGLTARGRPFARSVALTAALLASVVLLLVLVPQLGAMGAALATLGGEAATTIVILMLAHRSFGISPRRSLVVRLSDLRMFRGD